MLRKTLRYAQATRGPCGNRRRGQPEQGSPHAGAPARAGRGPPGISGGGRSSVGAEQGLPWGLSGKRGLQYLEPASMRQPARPGCLRLQSPQREDSALELQPRRTAGRQGKRLQEVVTPGGRGHGRARNHDQTQGHSQNWRAITSQTRGRRTDQRGSQGHQDS